MSVLGSPEELKTLPEKVILALAIKGELSAMEELIRRQQSQVRSFMFRLCRNRTEADDLAQQAFLKIWQGLSQLRQVSAYYGWQKMLMVNVWKESLRKHCLDFSDEDAPDLSDNKDGHPHLKRDLEWALDQLTPQKKLCVVLAYHEGLSHNEITEISGLPAGTVKSHIKRGSEQLRQLLDAYQSENAHA